MSWSERKHAGKASAAESVGMMKGCAMGKRSMIMQASKILDETEAFAISYSLPGFD